jgi:hypothetical protein
MKASTRSPDVPTGSDAESISGFLAEAQAGRCDPHGVQARKRNRREAQRRLEA